ncbi:nitrate- and nitrite sensing domain-containing protein [Streptomyces albipurpureus]|uniref:histidine kinase n=1 Tax=Streptomyces albipurpureus TaxID=2897419 RepID=A0ABT0UXK3_9ACTN|nr:nitrate- and nitrite sensing domain-containing protein [Streptomyces sp. CWNU-1]MCM2393292.1 nitrate- and nitrite sensing domain-containing protein [Streptomyces sp. CWNU-1]
MTGSAEQQARGNFTPPPRTAAPSEEPAPRPPHSTADGGPSGISPLSPRNWRVPTKLNAILLIPAIVALVMGGLQVKGSIETWDEAQKAEKTALIVRAASEYGEALLNERDLTATTLLAAESTASRQSDVIASAYAATDAARRKFDDAVRTLPEGQGLERRLTLFREQEPELRTLRATAYTSGMDPVATEEGYVRIQHPLMSFSNELGFGTGNVSSYGRTVYAIQLAKAAGSLQRSIGTHLLVRPSPKPDIAAKQAIAFNSYNYLESIAVSEFVSGGTKSDADRLQRVMAQKSAAVDKKFRDSDLEVPKEGNSAFAGMALQIGSGATPEALAKRGVTPSAWMTAATARFEGYSEVERELLERTVEEASSIAADAQRDAIINGLVTVLALLTAFIVAGAVARQMSRSMLRLRSAAFSIAEQRLPTLVDQLSRAEPGRVDTRVEPIPIDSQDEIGEVARAFDQVHREAVRLAAEQAMLRGNVNAIFTNLSRRNQSLIEGQLTLITELENGEADPDQLASLFKLDHLATRMRRNGENLLILAGEEPGRRWNQPVPLVDVLRAATSEVESYERIELSGVPESEIHGQAVTDLVHLLAELLENATTFSSPQTKVRVTATRLPDGRVMIEIHDKGIGLTAEDFADINHKLANPPTVDAAVSQRMGLFVVGRLADRHSVRVQLRPSGEQAGTTSLVMLPDAITHGGGDEQLPETTFTVSQIRTEQPAFASPPPRTAAELGFDDSRYEVAAAPAESAGKPDPMGRSRKREERRAALAAQSQDAGPTASPEPYTQPQEPSQPAQSQQGPDGQQQYVADFVQPYPQPAYPGQEFGQNGPHTEQGQPYGDFPGSASGGYPNQPMHQAPQQHQMQQQNQAHPGHPGSPYPEAAYPSQQPSDPQFAGQFEGHPHQGDWTDQSSSHNTFESDFRPESESASSVSSGPTTGSERVGFERPGPSSSSGHELTEAGLPRRGSQQKSQPEQRQPQQQWQPPGERTTQAAQSAQSEAVVGGGSGAAQTAAEPGDWHSTNDERWHRAEKLREPKAGGITASGLPRRVPKANLIEGAAEQSPQRGPQISRAPEDVRGRLSNLRRGVQQGRNAGADTNGPGFGPGSSYHQER